MLRQLVGCALGTEVVCVRANSVVAVVRARNDDGKQLPLDVKQGDRVLIGKYAGTEFKVEDQELLMIKEDEVLGIIEK